MKKNILLLVGGLFFGLILGAVIFGLGSGGASSSRGEAFALEQGKPMPQFTAPLLTGDEISLASLRGKTVLINFWATWCEPCKEEMPLLQQFADRYPDELVVIGINVDSTPGVLQPFLTENSIHFPIVSDSSELKFREKFRVQGFPTTYFVDQQGILSGTQIGLLDEELLSRHLESAGMKLP